MAEQTSLTDEQGVALLQLLSTDDDYRALFQKDLASALAQLPGQPVLSGESARCLYPKALASKKDIAQTLSDIRAKVTGKGVQRPHCIGA